MAYVSRWILVGTVACVGAMLGACSTMNLRGNTQSVAGDRPYSRPSYAGHRHGARQQRLRAAPPARSQATVRYHGYGTRRASPRIAPRYNEPAPAGLPQERSFALPPRVERLPTREPEWSRRQAPTHVQEPQYERRGLARWIGSSWRGHKTTSGEMFDADRLTGAHASLPVPSFVYVTNRANGRTVLIRINDRVPRASGRAVIVSQRAAELLDFRAAGRAEVDIQHAGPAAPVANDKHERAFLKRQPWYRNAMSRGAQAALQPAAMPENANRYPTPTYPRWDNTQR